MEEFDRHPTALVESSKIGKGTKISAFTHILPNAEIGRDCQLHDHVFIDNEVKIGDRVIIECGVQIWDGITINEDVTIGANVTFSNDPVVRKKQNLASPCQTIIHKGATLGANSTILPGISIGQYAMIGAGTVVTKDVPAFAITVGNPARIIGYVQTKTSALPVITKQFKKMPDDFRVEVKGVRRLVMPTHEDLRGVLSYGEVDQQLPFTPVRYFLVFNVPSKEIRGEHAHRKCHQLLLCAKGNCSIVVDDGENRCEFLLDTPNIGLYIPPMIWATQYKFSADSVLMVLASEKYDDHDYIRDYNQFLKEINKA